MKVRRYVIAVALLAASAGLLSTLGCGPSQTGRQDTTPTSVLEHVLTYNADYGSETLRVSTMTKVTEVIVMGTVTEGPTSRWNSEDGKEWTPKKPDDGPQFYSTWGVQVESR